MPERENRDFDRDRCRCPVQLRLEHFHDRRVRGETRNISLGGMYLVTSDLETPLILGSRVHIEVEVASGEPVVLRTEGQIIRSEPLTEGGRSLMGVAIKFNEVLEYHFPTKHS